MDFRTHPLGSGASLKWDSGPGGNNAMPQLGAPFGAPALFGLNGISLPPMPEPSQAAVSPMTATAGTTSAVPPMSSLRSSFSSSSFAHPHTRSDSIDVPALGSGNSGLLGSSGGGSMKVSDIDGFFVANPNAIDPFLSEVRDVVLNSRTEEYVWNPADSALYRVDTAQGRQALNEPGCTKFRFPPGTMILTKEKDGQTASPAYSPGHPHSNEWCVDLSLPSFQKTIKLKMCFVRARRLKAQVCHHRCPYRAGTASLKRPKTVRQHFEKVRFHYFAPLDLEQ